MKRTCPDIYGRINPNRPSWMRTGMRSPFERPDRSANLNSALFKVIGWA